MFDTGYIEAIRTLNRYPGVAVILLRLLPPNRSIVTVVASVGKTDLRTTDDRLLRSVATNGDPVLKLISTGRITPTDAVLAVMPTDVVFYEEKIQIIKLNDDHDQDI